MKKYNTINELYERLVDHIVTGYGNFKIRIYNPKSKLFLEIKDIVFEGNCLLLVPEETKEEN